MSCVTAAPLITMVETALAQYCMALLFKMLRKAQAASPRSHLLSNQRSVLIKQYVIYSLIGGGED